MLRKFWRRIKASFARRSFMRSRQKFLKKSGRLKSIRTLIPRDNRDRQRFLLACLQRYHEHLGSEMMDNVFLYLEEKLSDPKEALKIHDIARDDLNAAMYDYSFSLNAVAESADIIFEDNNVSIQRVLQGLNLILYAYSCNYAECEFLDKETKAMEDLLSKDFQT